MEDKNEASESPSNRLFTTMAWPVRGSNASKLTPDSSHEHNQISNIANKKIIAGSGSLLPTRSTKFKKRAINPVGTAA